MTSQVAVTVVAGPHSLSGKLDNRGLRILDLLNDPSTEYLQLFGVTVHHGLTDHIIQELPDATIPKAMIDLVLLEQSKHEAPLRRQHAMVKKRSYGAFVLVGDYEVRGNLSLKGAPDSIGALARELSGFCPLTSPMLSVKDSPQAPLSVSVALLHKSKIILLQIDQHAL